MIHGHLTIRLVRWLVLRLRHQRFEQVELVLLLGNVFLCLLIISQVRLEGWEFPVNYDDAGGD